MTVIKQKSVSSERYAKNVRKYINGKDALVRGGWNIEYSDRWFRKWIEPERFSITTNRREPEPKT